MGGAAFIESLIHFETAFADSSLEVNLNNGQLTAFNTFIQNYGPKYLKVRAEEIEND